MRKKSACLAVGLCLCAVLPWATGGSSQSQTVAAFGGDPCAGDVNGDGVTDILDFLDLLMNWGPCEEPCPPTCTGDLDGDCNVGIVDFLTVLADFGCGLEECESTDDCDDGDDCTFDLCLLGHCFHFPICD